MNRINEFIKIFLSLLMVYAPIQVQADEIIDNAQKVVDQSHEIAKSDALVLVKTDYMELVNDLAMEMIKESSRNELYTVYVDYVNKATESLQSLSQQNYVDDLTWKTIDQYKENYQEAIRNRFVAAWIPAKINEIHINTQAMIGFLLEGFNKQCTVGRGDDVKNYLVPTLHTPPYVSSLKGKVNPNPFGLITEGMPVSFNYSYVSATAGSEAANHDRAVAVNTAVTASNIANAAWLASQFSSLVGGASTAAAGAGAVGAAGSAMASVNVALIAAAPYLLAVAVVVMVVADLMGRAEAAKLANRINKAQKIMDANVADHIDVQKYYREQCGEYSSLLEEFSAVFADLSNPESEKNRVEKSKLLKDEILSWESRSNENTQNICQMNLGTLVSKHGCTQVPEGVEPSKWIKENGKLLMVEGKAETFCLVSPKKEVVEAANGQCAIPFEKSERESFIKDVAQKVESYQEDYPKEKVTELVAAKLSLTFSNPRALRKKINDVSFKRLDTLQDKAFLNLMQLMRVKREISGLSSSQKILLSEKEAQDTYLMYRNELLEIGIETQGLIFGKGQRENVLSQLQELKYKLKPFVSKYVHIGEVKELSRSVNYIIKLVEGLK